ncbi:hypothetical protein [Herbaspirillum frisingense]|uniref:hypothetical protein n=1 Tax=Herbaspirillum frisingense TaxID=92645 RepID=UPI001F1B878B|nr:hypothetical protein [Herbaspirillum frisingense]UIN21004.1 hypothetical protein LAZ82_21465 [Herbaspirillum frisingense]
MKGRWHREVPAAFFWQIGIPRKPLLVYILPPYNFLMRDFGLRAVRRISAESRDPPLSQPHPACIMHSHPGRKAGFFLHFLPH